MEIKVRPAVPEDAEAAYPLIYSAGAEGFDYVFNHKEKSALDFIRYAFADGRGMFGYRVHTVAEGDGRVAGIFSLYSGNGYLSLSMSTGSLILKFYGLRYCLPVFRRSAHSLSILPPPAKDMEYVADFGVAEDMRGKGIGTALLNYGLEIARKRNRRRFALDVAVTNGRAQKLYERFGFSVTGLNRFSGPRDPEIVPDSRRMEIML